MKKILITGGTGTVGGEVLSQLACAGQSIRAMVRNPEMAKVPNGVELVAGDLTRPETLAHALEGMDVLFLVWTAPSEAAEAAIECIRKTVPRVVFLTAPIKTQHPLFQASLPNAMSLLNGKIEELIESSGLDWTFLRPGMFAANSAEWWAPQIRAGDHVRWAYLETPTAPVDEHDMAAVAVRALIEDSHAKKEYVITGPESLTQREQIQIIGDAIGKKLSIEEISPEEAKSEWAGFMPEFVIHMLLKSWAAAAGRPAFISQAIAEVTGIKPKSFADWVSRNTEIFKR